MGSDAILVGDRIADFLLRGADGATRSFHAWHVGQPLCLLALTATDTPAREALRAFAAAPADAARLLLVADGARAALATDDAALETYEAPLPVLQALTGGAASGWRLLRLDQALRLQEGTDDAAAIVGLTARAAMPGGQAGSAEDFAPVLHVPAVLEPALCAEAIAFLRERRRGGQASGVVVIERGQPQFRLDPSIKMRREAVLDDPALEARIHERVQRRVLPEIRRAFQFQVIRREPFKVIGYAAGQGYFRAHRDNESSDTAHRRFAITLNLNTGEYEGGLLRFPEFGPRLYRAEAGAALVFSCSLLHEATDVVAGTRMALTGFFWGER